MKNRLINFFLALFPAIIIFIVIPFSIYVPNQQDFYYDIRVMAPFLAVFCGYAGVSAILAYFSHKSFLFRWLFFFGIFLLVKDVLSPVVAKGLIGQHERIFIEEPLLGILAEFLALSGFIILGFFTSNQVLSKIFVPAAIVFIFVNTIFVIIQMNWPFLHSDERRNGNYIEKAIVSNEISRGNVYLICLDSFLGPAFVDVIKDSDLENSFEGFVYFPKNLANYDFTLPSLASVLSGSLYTKGSMQTWHDKAIMQAGIMGMFSNLGYDIWQYADEKHNSVSRERYRTTTEKVSQLNKYLLMIDVWIVRISPTLIRKEIWEKLTKKNKIYNSAVSDFVVRALEMLNKFADEENDRPSENQLVYVHAYIPHKPFVFSGNCDERINEGDFLGQGLCSLRPIARFIDILKKKEIFSKSTIIIFSDHGVRGKGTEKYRDMLLDEWRKPAIGNKFPFPLDVSSLLLIKPPHSGDDGHLIISERYSQNLDIAVTLRDLTKIDVLFESGQSLFSKNFNQDRKIDVFTGFDNEIYKKIKRESIISETIKGNLYHFQFNTKTGWKRLPTKNCFW